MPVFRRVLGEEGLPEDTVYLAMIESGFANLATSRAKAVGAWQFIPATGKRFGMKQDFWVDERRDPEKAARIREEDDAMDDLHRHLFTVLMDREWKHGVAAAVDVTLLGRFYERFADHAVEVARRIIFQVTGKLPDEEEIPAPR